MSPLDTKYKILNTGCMYRKARFYLRWKKAIKRVKFLNFLALFGFFLALVAGTITAQTLRPQFSQSKDTVVKATVGTNRLTLTGYHSPYASIVLKTGSDVFLSSTTADANGYFTISNVLINGSELTYCFLVTDFKRLGISESCITLNGPIVGDVTVTDIFLPPTIALSRKVINAGEDAAILGYTMPGAKVFINIQGNIVQVTADDTGYYNYLYKNVPAGSFTITVTANFNDTDSVEPTNNVTLEAKTIPQKIIDEGKKTVDKTKDFIEKKVPFDWWPFLLLALAFLTGIGILLYKLKFGPFMVLVDFFKHKKKMHHDWFLEKW